jgi:hypothetical protein
MYEGRGGWGFPEKTFPDAHKLSIIIMTTTSERVNGHVGILTEDVQYGKICRMAHASSKWGFIEITVEATKENWVYPKITKIREPEVR